MYRTQFSANQPVGWYDPSSQASVHPDSAWSGVGRYPAYPQARRIPHHPHSASTFFWPLRLSGAPLFHHP